MDGYVVLEMPEALVPDALWGASAAPVAGLPGPLEADPNWLTLPDRDTV